MGAVTLDRVRASIVCPRCRGPLADSPPDGLRCTTSACALSAAAFPVVAGQPVLVDFEHSVVARDQLSAHGGTSVVERHSAHGILGPIRRLATPPNRVAERHAALLRDALVPARGRPIVLVVGGGTLGNGAASLYSEPALDVIGFDVYASPLTACIADGHQIPLANGSVDAVWVQAVLEHVLDPACVVAEIHRVLRPAGLVYAETPFLQAVHEGPWDFTRFTESGHRWLFRAFERLDSGLVAGPGLAASWALDYLVRGWSRSRPVGQAARLATSWLAALDRFIPDSLALDGASCVFFYGKRSERLLTPHEIIAHYRGAQRPLTG